jgi:hypothetical protein
MKGVDTLGLAPHFDGTGYPRWKVLMEAYLQTRSGGGQDIPPVVRAHIANQQNQAPPPPLNPAMDPATQQFLAVQMQVIQNLTATIQNIQAQQNQPPPAAPLAPVDKNKEFMSHRPPTYSHSIDPLDADD